MIHDNTEGTNTSSSLSLSSLATYLAPIQAAALSDNSTNMWAPLGTATIALNALSPPINCSIGILNVLRDCLMKVKYVSIN